MKRLFECLSFISMPRISGHFTKEMPNGYVTALTTAESTLQTMEVNK